ncbi:hypothetical protein DFH28DRAFT_878607 [Melampsora americana]|nr:hypothetical protein DFH28DRAFT_878607 [Melampsora americana]
MEAQNGTTRAASVKSNHHAPGKDISNTFNNERLVRMLCSGASFFDSKIGTRTTASKHFRELFDDKEIRHSLGLHLPRGTSLKDQLKVIYTKLDHSQSNTEEPPIELSNQWPTAQWRKGLQVVLESGRKVVSGTFVLIDFAPEGASAIKIGRVSQIWHQLTSNKLVLQVRKIKLTTGLHPFYGMREIKETNQHAFIDIKVFFFFIHRPEVIHQSFNSFMINAGSHYASEYHRFATQHVWSEVTPAEWQESIKQGLSAWFERCPPKSLGNIPVDDAMQDDEDQLGQNHDSLSLFVLDSCADSSSIVEMSDWDDLFGDDMIVEEDDGVIQTPNEPSRREWNRASRANTAPGDSPYPGPATLFRPPAQRNAPGQAPSRLAANRASVKKYADLLKLTKENHEVLQKMIDNTVRGEEYLGTLSYLVFICQECKVSSGSKWVPGRVIRDTLKEQVGEFILRADVQAYSKTVAEDYTSMLQSLEVLTFNYVKGLTPEFLEEHGPGDYVAGEGCVPGTAMHVFIKETLKNQRSKVRGALLTKILGVAEGSPLKVPAAKTMVLQVGRTFICALRAMDDDTALGKLGRVKVKRIIFMRYVTAYYYLNQTENKKRCQWTLMDEALAALRERPESDANLYFDRVARFDRDAFNGKRTWAEIKSCGLPAPFVEQVLALGQGTSALGATSGSGNVSGGTSSGNQETEEDFEEEQNPSEH